MMICQEIVKLEKKTSSILNQFIINPTNLLKLNIIPQLKIILRY